MTISPAFSILFASLILALSSLLVLVGAWVYYRGYCHASPLPSRKRKPILPLSGLPGPIADFVDARKRKKVEQGILDAALKRLEN